LFGEDDPGVLDGPYTDYDAFLNAELPPFLSISGRFIHFDNTGYILSSRVDCRVLPVDSVSTFELLELSADVNVKDWIRYHNADFGNEYARIQPERHAMLSGSVRLIGVRVEHEARPYGLAEEVNLQVVYYRLKAEELLFEGGVRMPSVETQEHSCFVGDGFGRGE
jgi:hypothetical protein